MTDKAVCDELGVSTRQFSRWRDELALLGNDTFPGSGVTRDGFRSILEIFFHNLPCDF